MTENTEATPLQPDPDSPAGVDIGEGQEQEIPEEYLENTDAAREKILENDGEE